MPAVLNVVEVNPIILCACCICQRQRDDQGQWQAPAAVAASPGREIAFTHTICPECARRYYPEFYQPGQDLPDQGS